MCETQTRCCTKCGEEKPITEYHANRRYREGYVRRCKVCHAETMRAWYVSNKERSHANTRSWRENNRERARDIYRAWVVSNPDKVMLKAATRRAARLNATPRWADKNHIRKIYAEAALRRAAGENVHVDHVVPLRGKTVTGLHVPANLAIVAASENWSKAHHRWPDMWETACA